MEIDDLLWEALKHPPKNFAPWKKLLNELADTGWTLYCRKYEDWDNSRNNYVGPSQSFQRIEQFLKDNDLHLSQLTYEVYDQLYNTQSDPTLPLIGADIGNPALGLRKISRREDFLDRYFSWEAVGLLKYFKDMHTEAGYPDFQLKHLYIEITDFLKSFANLNSSHPTFTVRREIRYNLIGDSEGGVSIPWGSETFNFEGSARFIFWVSANLEADGKFEVDEF